MRRHNQRVCHPYRRPSFFTFTYYFSTGVVIITTQLRNHVPAVARVSLSFLSKFFYFFAHVLPQFAASSIVKAFALTFVATTQFAMETWTRHPASNASARKASGRPQPTTKTADVC